MVFSARCEPLAGDVEWSLASGVKEPLAGDVEELLVGDVEEPLAGDVEEPIAGNVEGPLAGDVEVPLAGDVKEPLAGDIEFSIAGDVEEPLAGDVKEPIAGDVEVPLAGDVEGPLAGDVKEPLAGDVEGPLAGDVEVPLAGEVEGVYTAWDGLKDTAGRSPQYQIPSRPVGRVPRESRRVPTSTPQPCMAPYAACRTAQRAARGALGGAARLGQMRRTAYDLDAARRTDRIREARRFELRRPRRLERPVTRAAARRPAAKRENGGGLGV